MKILVFNGFVIVVLLLGGGVRDVIWLFLAFTASCFLEK